MLRLRLGLEEARRRGTCARITCKERAGAAHFFCGPKSYVPKRPEAFRVQQSFKYECYYAFINNQLGLSVREAVPIKYARMPND